MTGVCVKITIKELEISYYILLFFTQWNKNQFLNGNMRMDWQSSFRTYVNNDKQMTMKSAPSSIAWEWMYLLTYKTVALFIKDVFFKL